MSRSVQRALVVIERISESPRSLGELAEHVGVHKSTVLRLLQTLEPGGFARRTSEGRWTLGSRFIGIAHRALDGFDLPAAAVPHLRALADRCGHTAHLGQYVDGEIVLLVEVEGRNPVRTCSRVGHRMAIHASGVGKAILAHLEPELQERILDRAQLEGFTPTTITDRTQLEERLAVVRSRSWALEDGEFEDTVVGVAAPVRNSDGSVRAAIALTAPRAVMDLTPLVDTVPELLQTAARISADAGWDGR